MFAVDDRVTWISSCTRKEGVVVEVVPAGSYPQSMGRSKLGMHRDHETYVVKGGERGKRTALYWPRVSLLQKAGHLSPEEIAWCHTNAERVRRLISASS